MSHRNMDPALTTQQDADFRRGVLSFFQPQVPGTANTASRPSLKDLINAYLSTCRNPEMATLLLSLHNAYGLATLIDQEHLDEARNTVDRAQNAPATASPTTPVQSVGSGSSNTPQRGIQSPRAMHVNSPPGQAQSQPHASAYPLSPLESSSLGQGQHASVLPPSNSPLGPNRFSSALPSSGSPGQVQYRSAFHYHSSPGQKRIPNTLLSKNPPGQLQGCFPEGLKRGEHDTDDRSDGWYYKCDRCHHLISYRSELNRHGKEAGRDGFKVIYSNAEEERVWYAEDATGNEYTGKMIPAIQRLATRQPVPEPCGSIIRQYNADKKREQVAAANKGGGN